MRASAALQAVLLFATLGSGLAAAEPVIIVNPDTTSDANLEKVRRIFLGKDRSLDGSKTIVPIEVDDKSIVRADYLNKLVGKNEGQLRSYWSRLMFTGKANPPRNVGGDEAVKNWVAHNKDTIGLIDSAMVDHSVRVLVPLR